MKLDKRFFQSVGISILIIVAIYSIPSEPPSIKAILAVLAAILGAINLIRLDMTTISNTQAELSASLARLAALLDLQHRQLVDSSHNPHIARLIDRQKEEITHATSHQEISFRSRPLLLEEALRLTNDTRVGIVAKNHIPARIWRNDPAGSILLANYFHEQIEAVRNKKIDLQRIHIYDKSEIASWPQEAWNDLQWFAETHEKADLKFLLCEKQWDQMSPRFAGKGLLVPDPGEGTAILLFDLAEIGAQEGGVIFNSRILAEAAEHMSRLLKHAIPWKELRAQFP